VSYYDERREALYRSWPELETKAVNKITLEDLETWSAQLRTKYGKEWSGSSFNHSPPTRQLSVDPPCLRRGQFPA